jgi:stage II sporulation protein D
MSSDFTVTIKDDTVIFSGFGKGHGVGLCLYSASALAQNGENAVKILSKFFPETYLYNINALPSD